MIHRCVFVVLIALLVVGISSRVWADEMDEIMRIEAIVNEPAGDDGAVVEVQDDGAVVALKKELKATKGRLLRACQEIRKLRNRLRTAEESLRFAGMGNVSAPQVRAGTLDGANVRIGQLEDALRKMAEKHEREMQHSYYNMGCVYRAARQYDRAEKQFLNALSVDPDDAGVHYNLAILYDDDLKKKDMARKHYEAFLSLAPHDQDSDRVREWLAVLQ